MIGSKDGSSNHMLKKHCHQSQCQLKDHCRQEDPCCGNRGRYSFTFRMKVSLVSVVLVWFSPSYRCVVSLSQMCCISKPNPTLVPPCHMGFLCKVLLCLLLVSKVLCSLWPSFLQSIIQWSFFFFSYIHIWVECFIVFRR